MKITRIQTVRADRFMYVKVETDEGITGIGELHPASGTGGTPYLPLAGVEYCAEYLVGQDPRQTERHWQHLFRRCLFRGGADAMAAIGALDIALWDIKGKELGRPVHELLGGPTRERIRLYTHLSGNTPQALAEQALACVEQGYTAVRLYPFGDFGAADFEEGRGLESMSYAAMIRSAEERVAAVREALGPDVDIMIDVVNRLSPAEAIAVGRALEPYRLFFFEDPIEPENMDAWQYVAANVPMPVAMGERLYTIYQFQDLLEHKGAAFVRPDLSLAGGFSNIKKIAALAEAYYAGVVPHNPLSCVLTAACAQLSASIHNLTVLEYPRDEQAAPKRDLVKEPLRREGGYLLLPDAPGIGIELNEEAFAHYPPVPYVRPPLVGPDGGLRDY
jgi:galactonate dehydratase